MTVSRSLISLTKSAKCFIKEFIKPEYNNYFFITINTTGCNGYTPQFEIRTLEDTNKMKTTEDIFIQHEDINMWIDGNCIDIIKGSIIDYLPFPNSPMVKGLQITNPNFTSQCGCGISFGI